MTDTPSPKHVFMSYSRRDEAVMRRVTGFLRKQGINVWVDNEKLVPGTPIWEAEIEKAIKSTSAVIVILSPDSKNSEWVRREITLADQYHTRIFPVLVRGDEDSSISIRLITRQYVDLRQDEEIGLISLHKALSSYLEILGFQESWARTEATEMEARQKAELEVAEKVAHKKAENEAADKTIQERKESARLEREEKAAKEKIERERTKEGDFTKSNTIRSILVSKRLFQTWRRRSLLGGIMGIILGLAYANISPFFQVPEIVIFAILCGLAGLITYPHKFSIVFLILGFLVGGFIYYENINFTDTGNFIVGGGLLGIPAGALLSRILHWIKVLR